MHATRGVRRVLPFQRALPVWLSKSPPSENDPGGTPANASSDVDDWQLVATPQNTLPRVGGADDDGMFNTFVNRFIVAQLVGCGSNVDFSPIVDQGLANKVHGEEHE